jgi:hypothetical protein
VNKLAANIVGTLLTILFCAAGVALVHVLPNHARWSGWHPTALLVSIIALLPLHEGLHALGLLWFARVCRADIRFGVMWHALTPYCGCKVPIPVHAYRRMALLPLWVTGITTVVCLLLFRSNWLGLLAGITIAACVGDVWVVLKLSPFAGDLFAQDCASEIGCDVLSAIP